MPLQNYKDLENEFLVNYWEQGKDILGISNFAELVPEVVCLGPGYEAILKELIAMRIDLKLKKSRGDAADDIHKEKILKNKKILKDQLETRIVDRLEAIRKYLRNPVSDPHLSREEIFLEQGKSRLFSISPILNFLSNQKKWIGRLSLRRRKPE